MSRKEDAAAMFGNGANCAQSVLCSFADDVGLRRETAMRVSTPFGGGMGTMAETCGAVTGAFMVIGMRHGVSAPEHMKENKDRIYAQVREFARRFAGRNGSLVCRELLGCDISTPEGMKEARTKNLFATRCPQLVQDAVEIVEKML